MSASRGRRVAFSLVLVTYASAFLFTFHEADEDVWGRMAVGRLVLSSDGFPYRDVFAYVPTKPLWVDHEWLSGVVFYEVHRRFGDAGLVLLRAALGLGAVLLAFAVGSRPGRAAALAGDSRRSVARRLSDGSRPGRAAALADDSRRSVAPGFAAALSVATAVLLFQGFNGLVRAQAFTFASFALVWWLLETGERRVWLIVPLTMVWANLHGGFVTGLGLVAMFALLTTGRRRELTGVLAAAVVVTLVNPYGVSYWSYLADALTMPRPDIVEWRRIAVLPALSDLHWKLAAILVAVLLLQRRAPLHHVVLVVGAVAASFLHVRFAPFLGLAIAGTLPRSLERAFEAGHDALPARWLPSAVPVAATAVLVALTLVGGAVAWRNRDLSLRLRVPADRYPVGAVRALAGSGAKGRLAVYFNWGEYALYHLHPHVLVSIDGRYETVYDDAVVAANWTFTRTGGARFFEAFPADFALYPIDSGAAKWLSDSPDWEVTHSENSSVLYTKHQN